MSVINLTSESFDTETSIPDTLILIDFYADWCGPCRMVAPLVAEIAEERPDIRVFKVNIDNEPSLAEKFDVESIPTLIIMKNGGVLHEMIGARPKEDILSLLNE